MKSIMDDCRQVDAGRWEIYEGIRVIGYFESDGKSYEFKSCAGPTIGGNGEIYGNQPVKWYLVHFAKTLKIKYYYKRWRQEVEVEEEAKSPAVGKVAELEQEYKRVVWMSSAKKGRAYWKGYLSALQFAIDVLSKE